MIWMLKMENGNEDANKNWMLNTDGVRKASTCSNHSESEEMRANELQKQSAMTHKHSTYLQSTHRSTQKKKKQKMEEKSQWHI